MGRKKMSWLTKDQLSHLNYFRASHKERHEVWLPGNEIFKLPKDLKNIDFILFEGGADVNPSLYGHDNIVSFIDEIRDDKEVQLYNKVLDKVLKVGICRGGQFLNVMSGGKMIQDLEGHNSGSHMIDILDQSQSNNFVCMETTSGHHQLMVPTLDADIIAVSPQKSEYYIHDAIDTNKFYFPGKLKGEVEILYYPNTHSLCIQGHPEWDTNLNSIFVRFCTHLIGHYVNKK
jgi:gamma-glutamyl-gamma-aminobutyrate hydrolase PuuD